MDDSDVELDEEGDYFLCYVAEDGYGLKTVKEAHVLVATPEAIQDLNGSRQIDYRRDTILGAHNIYDVGQRLTKILTRDTGWIKEGCGEEKR